jgi:hypothetical protein
MKKGNLKPSAAEETREVIKKPYDGPTNEYPAVFNGEKLQQLILTPEVQEIVRNAPPILGPVYPSDLKAVRRKLLERTKDQITEQRSDRD